MKFRTWKVEPKFGYYGNGRIALQLFDPETGEQIATATVNMANSDPCGSGEIYVKEWSENAGMTKFLADNGIIEPASLGEAKSGYVTAHRYKLTQQYIAKLDQQA